MCWVTSTGDLSITAPSRANRVFERLRPAGRRADQQGRAAAWPAKTRCISAGCAAVAGAAARGARPYRCGRGAAGRAAERGARGTLRRAARIFSISSRRKVVEVVTPGCLRLGHVVRGAERQGLQRDLGVAPRQGRGHDDDEVALLARG